MCPHLGSVGEREHRASRRRMPNVVKTTVTAVNAQSMGSGRLFLLLYR